jgi:hypothetical protein
MNIQSLVEDFTNQLSSLLERDAVDRARAVVESALGGSRAGARAKLAAGVRRPKQLCPVPGCKNPAAPVFGMVCAKHKDISKAQIAKYRDARRAKKQKTKGGARKRAARSRAN